jgi:hypothetical protein
LRAQGAGCLPNPAMAAVDQKERYVAVSFRRVGNEFVPGPVIECPDASFAIQRAALMMREEDIVGAVAFSRRGGPASGEVEAAVILQVFGATPEGFDIA